MPDLNSLGLNEDAAPPVDWDAPEAGRQPPAIYPGLYKFLFKLPESRDDWFDSVERETVKGQPTSKRNFLELTFTPQVMANSQGQALAGEDGTAIVLGPQRVNTFMSKKMRIHRLAELLRAMGVRIEGNMLAVEANGKRVIENTVAQLDGKATFFAEVIWRAYFKSTNTTVSTHPRGKDSGEILWPRNADGQPELLAKNPSTGESAYGYVEIASIKAPTSEDVAGGNGQTMATAAV